MLVCLKDVFSWGWDKGETGGDTTLFMVDFVVEMSTTNLGLSFGSSTVLGNINKFIF